MSISLGLASAVYLGWILHMSLKKRIPMWVHKYFDRIKDVKQAENEPGPLQNVLPLSACIALYFVLDAVGFGLDAMYENTILFIPAIIMMGLVLWIVRRNLANYWHIYSVEVAQEEKQNALKKAYGVKEWATGDDIRNRLSSKK